MLCSDLAVQQNKNFEELAPSGNWSWEKAVNGREAVCFLGMVMKEMVGLKQSVL